MDIEREKRKIMARVECKIIELSAKFAIEDIEKSVHPAVTTAMVASIAGVAAMSMRQVMAGALASNGQQ